MTIPSQPYERRDLRTSPEIKSLIVRAAATAGVSLSAFLIASAQARAKQILAESETLMLSPCDWDAFFVALDNIDKPRPKLETAATDYLAWRNSTDAR
ncbi:MAG: hypothetical protein B7Y41_01450 [Hydrogenophilales bacterium 28-61-23]|nr:MAG: hypothetical protein B7Y41_01450 [Hydrogenophilales bacterium 28-61-23]